jgi:hypothetical protein
MKTVKISLLLTAVICLLFSCSKIDNDDVISGIDLKAKKVTHEVFIVEPNGVDDTPALCQAFDDAKAAGPGSVVKLVEGNYSVGLVEIREFYGKFTGAGKGKTVITARNDLDIAPLLSQRVNPYLIKFVGGDVFMSEMTIRTPDGILTLHPIMTWIEGLVSFSARTRIYASLNDYIRGTISNVEFISGSDWPSGWRSNCNTGLVVGFDSRFVQLAGGWPLSPSDVTVTNCYFENFDIYGALIAYINKGEVKVTGENYFNHNSTAAYGYGGSLAFWHNNDLKVTVSDNTFLDGPGARFGIEATSSPWPAFLQYVDQTRATVFDIERNDFLIEGATGGVLVNDQRRVLYPEAIPMMVNIKSNKFILSENAFTGLGCFNMSGMVIRNNTFSGEGSYGVRVMRTAPVYNENGLILGNNFSNSTYAVTPVLLNPGSRNWTVVGGNLGESVMNYGENNRITGFNINYSEAPFGESISDNLKEMREAIKSLREK